MNDVSILGAIVDHALERGASTCNIMLRQGVGMVVYDVGNLIEQVRTITPKEFADCNAQLQPFLQVPGQHLAKMQSGMMGYNSIRGPIAITIRSFLHIEPVLSLQFAATPPIPISFAELNISDPTSLAIRQFLTSSQKMLFVTSDNTASDQLAFMQASLGVLSLYGQRPLLYCGAPLPLTTPAILNTPTIDSKYKFIPGWPQSVIMHNHFTAETAALLSTPPFPQKLVITDPSAINLRQTIARNKQYLQMFIDPSIYMPATPLYVQAMPRLCYRCRQQINMKRSDFEWLQTKLSGSVTVDYTTLDRPKQETTAADTPQITQLNNLGGSSLLDMIARDPEMVNRSEQDKYREQTEIKTIQAWTTVKKNNCHICKGSGQDGFVLSSGFGEINASSIIDSEELRSAQDRISSRFWVDVFDKVQNGLVGIDYVAKLAVALNKSAPETSQPAPFIETAVPQTVVRHFDRPKHPAPPVPATPPETPAPLPLPAPLEAPMPPQPIEQTPVQAPIYQPPPLLPPPPMPPPIPIPQPQSRPAWHEPTRPPAMPAVPESMTRLITPQPNVTPDPEPPTPQMNISSRQLLIPTGVPPYGSSPASTIQPSPADLPSL